MRTQPSTLQVPPHAEHRDESLKEGHGERPLALRDRINYRSVVHSFVSYPCSFVCSSILRLLLTNLPIILVVREDVDLPSELEKIAAQAKSLAVAALRSSRSGSRAAFGVNSSRGSALARSISTPCAAEFRGAGQTAPSSPLLGSPKMLSPRVSALLAPPTLMRVMSAPVDLSRMGTDADPTKIQLGGLKSPSSRLNVLRGGAAERRFGGSKLAGDARTANADRIKESFKQLYR